MRKCVLILNRLVLSIFSFMLICCFFIIDVSASSSVDATISLDDGLTEVVYICDTANNSVSSLILEYNSSSGLLKFSNKNYSELDQGQKEDFMRTALVATTETSLNARMKNKVYNFIAKQDEPISSALKYIKSDASADFVTARAWFSPISGIVGTVIGFICILIFAFTGLSIVFDCAYLSIPFFQALLEHGDTVNKPFGVSREAFAASREVALGEKRNVMSVYISKRVPVLIVMFIALGYIVSGQVYDLLVYLINAFTGIFR